MVGTGSAPTPPRSTPAGRVVISAMVRFAPVLEAEHLLDHSLVRPGRTLYRENAFVSIPDREVPVVVDHGDTVGRVRQFLTHKDVDGAWFCAVVDLDNPPSWLRRGTPVSFSFIPLHRSTVYGAEVITRAFIREISLVSSALVAVEAGARVLTIERTDTGPTGEIPCDGRIIVRPRVGHITGVR